MSFWICTRLKRATSEYDVATGSNGGSADGYYGFRKEPASAILWASLRCCFVWAAVIWVLPRQPPSALRPELVALLLPRKLAVSALLIFARFCLDFTALIWGSVRGGRQHKCHTCGVLLLTGEKSGFCCGPNGNRFLDVKPLPPLPPEFNIFLNDRDISKLSRRLNLILSFASLETTHPFPRPTSGPPGFVAIGGRVYHRVRPNHANSAVRWLLYDGFEDDATAPPHSGSDWFREIPQHWTTAFRDVLLHVNSFALDPVEPSENIYLPSSFLGSWRWASEQIADSLALVLHSASWDQARGSGRHLIFIGLEADGRRKPELLGVSRWDRG
ncbi:hypothetical protein C8F01DRAFT_1261856 [Mycena amicta]|nr:hypothetical protein C8F01DRAFT_1261856 [Mycena amicta]